MLSSNTPVRPFQVWSGYPELNESGKLEKLSQTVDTCGMMKRTEAAHDKKAGRAGLALSTAIMACINFKAGCTQRENKKAEKGVDSKKEMKADSKVAYSRMTYLHPYQYISLNRGWNMFVCHV
eukprot:scaffold60662_cov18-Tisochrysis_lutea.AAC.1